MFKCSAVSFFKSSIFSVANLVILLSTHSGPALIYDTTVSKPSEHFFKKLSHLSLNSATFFSIFLSCSFFTFISIFSSVFSDNSSSLVSNSALISPNDLINFGVISLQYETLSIIGSSNNFFITTAL